MTDSTPQHRTPPGRPDGGRYAARTRADADTTLDGRSPLTWTRQPAPHPKASLYTAADGFEIRGKKWAGGVDWRIYRHDQLEGSAPTLAAAKDRAEQLRD